MTEPQLQQALDGIRLISQATGKEPKHVLESLYYLGIIDDQTDHNNILDLL